MIIAVKVFNKIYNFYHYPGASTIFYLKCTSKISTNQKIFLNYLIPVYYFYVSKMFLFVKIYLVSQNLFFFFAVN
jgi:hypothetical protein